MPGIVTDDIEIIRTPGGGRGGSSSDGSDGSGGRGGDGSGSGGSGSVPQRTYITGMTVGLGGILMFFMALVSAYIVRKDIPNSGWHPLAVPRILWLNTAVLIASSFTLSHARKLLKSNDQQGFRHWWSVTTILGVFFLAGQIIAWQQLRAAGLHLLGGVLALTWILFRPTHRLTQGTATEVAAMYWHFMDGLWVFLFLLF